MKKFTLTLIGVEKTFKNKEGKEINYIDYQLLTKDGKTLKIEKLVKNYDNKTALRYVLDKREVK